VNNSTLAKEWGAQFRELQFAQTWYNNFRTNPGQMQNTTDQAKRQQWLDQYAFALRQAGAVIRGGTNANGQNNGSNNNSQVNNNSLGFGTPQQQLGQWLHRMRGLREKLSGLSNNMGVENSNSTSTTP
jgi:hypothetical protein